MNTPVQMVLKQEQVETSTTDWTDDTAEADFTVFHRSVVDNLKKNIRVCLYLQKSLYIYLYLKKFKKMFYIEIII